MIRDSADLQKHVLATYLALRVGMSIVAALFPFMLWGGEALLSGDLRLHGTMSAYYHSRVGDVFVGVLFAIGAVLYLYKGFSRKENCALNLAGFFAVAIALLPTDVPAPLRGDCACEIFTSQLVHAICAVLFFVCIAYVAIFRATDTLYLINDPARQHRYTMLYRGLGIAMLVVPMTAAVMLLAFQLGRDPSERTIGFVVEALAVLIFAAYWGVKSLEIAETGADEVALNQQMPPPAEQSSSAKPNQAT